MELNINTSKTYRDIEGSKRICILQGGTRSSKSYSALQWILVKALTEPNMVFSIVRKSFPSMRVSIMRDWVGILKGLEIWDDNNWSATEHIYTFDNGSIVEFMSIDSLPNNLIAINPAISFALPKKITSSSPATMLPTLIMHIFLIYFFF